MYDGKLDLSHSYQTENPITDLTGIALFVNLTELNCSGHALTSIDLSSNLNLVELRCTNNLLTSLDVSNNSPVATMVVLLKEYIELIRSFF